MAKKGTLEITILGDEKPLAKSMDKATGIMKSWAGGAAAIFAGVGIAGAAALVHEFGDAMERGRLSDRLGAQLGATAEESARYGKIAGELFVDAYGESLAEVHDAVDAVVSTLGDEGDAAVSSLTAKALDLAAAFDVDVEEAVNAVGVAVRSGLVKDAEQGFDLVVASMQAVPRAMRGELIPIVEEYGTHFAALGIDGEDAFGLLVSAADLGNIALDKTGDALKELTIRATDMSTASVEAFDAMGLDAEVMAGRILAGGDTARGAFDDILAGLLAIDDPTEQATAAIALMGTPLEDLGTDKIPAFLLSLSNMDGSLTNTEGAAERMGDTLNDNVATKVETFKRRAGAALDLFLAEHVLPVADDVINAFNEDGVGGAVDVAIAAWEDSQPRVEAWFNGTFAPWWEGTAVPWMSYAGGAMGTAMVNGLLEAMISLVPEMQRKVLEAIEKALPLSGLGAILNQVGFSDLPDLPSINLPNLNNPVKKPGTKPIHNPGPPSERFHGGGVTPNGGMAELAAKERVLSARQTESFDRLVASITSPTGGTSGGVTINMPAGSDGDDVVRALKRWTDRNGPLPLPVR